MARYRFDSCRFDSADGSLDGPRGETLRLRPQVARLLELLLEEPGQIRDREAIRLAVWGPDVVVDFESGLAALVKELRHALEACGASAAMVETVPRRGYRFNAEVESGEPGSARFTLRGVRAVVAGLILIVALAAAAWYFLAGPDPGPAPDRTWSLAILPPERFGDPERPPERAEILLADALLARLWDAGLDDLVLVGRTSTRPYQHRDDVAEALAADLGVDLLIEGSVVAGETSWSVQLRLLSMPGGRILWSESTEQPGTGRLDTGSAASELIGRLGEAWPEILSQRGLQAVSD